jgi:hypothetical protein
MFLYFEKQTVSFTLKKYEKLSNLGFVIQQARLPWGAKKIMMPKRMKLFQERERERER